MTPLIKDWEQAKDLLSQEKTSTVLVPLAKIPLELDEQLVIAALSERTDPGYELIIHPDFFEKKAIFKLKTAALVVTDTVLASSQLNHFRPDLAVEVSDKPAAARYSDLIDGNCAGLLLPAGSLDDMPELPEGFSMLSLHPKEFIPCPGQGVNAWLARTTDKVTRKTLLQRHHHAATAENTNIERKTWKLLPESARPLTGIYSTKDESGYYHAAAVRINPQNNHCRFFRISSSTNFGLAEKIIEGLESSDTA